MSKHTKKKSHDEHAVAVVVNGAKVGGTLQRELRTALDTHGLDAAWYSVDKGLPVEEVSLSDDEAAQL